VFELRFQALRRQKAARENRNITLRDVVAETGLSLKTIKKVAREDAKGLKIETLGALAEYFDVSSIAELIEFKP
jgi:transcriptional regulator with XRE-family HTH domain